MKKTLVSIIVVVAVTDCCNCNSCRCCKTISGEPEPAVSATADPARELFLLDSLEGGSMLLHPSKLGGIARRGIAAKYAIVVGAYRNDGNARRRAEECRENGFETDIVDFRNGLHAVTTGHSDSIEEVLGILNSGRMKSLSPAEPWILVEQ